MDTEEGVEVIIFILGRGSELVYQHSGMYSRGRVSRPTEERRRVNGSRRWGGRALEGGKAVEMGGGTMMGRKKMSLLFHPAIIAW